jgi:colanic acid/amylovoran biosynthesis glycosyltransferase
LNVAYLINQYPAPSHSFIRREIVALRALGINLSAFSIRRSSGKLISRSDLDEAARTRVILDAGWGSLVGSTIGTFVMSPTCALRALYTAIRLGRTSDRGILRHLAYFAEACVLQRRLKQAGIDHLHAHMGTNAATVAMLCQRVGGPPWSFTVHGPEEFVRGDSIALREKIAVARFVVGISDFTIQELRKWCDESQWPKLKRVRCGVDGDFLDAPATPVPDVNRIVCIGRLCPVKMQHVLIEAIAKLVARAVNVHLTLVGDGETRADLERQVDTLNLRSHMHFAGWCDEPQVREHLRAARAKVLASRAEGLPVAIMESYALGRPVISTAVAGIPELVEPGKSGWLVPPDNSMALAAAIQECMDTPVAALTEMAAVGRERVIVLHDVSKSARELVKIFRSHS